MVRVLFLVLLGSFWIISGAEAHHVINLEMSNEPRIVRPKIPRESMFLNETLNVRIVSEIPVVAKVQILLCYVGEVRPSYSFASFLVESKTKKNNYILDYNLFVHKGMKGIWYCTLLFDRDPIRFELDVYVTSPKDVSSKAEIATEIGFYSNVLAPTNIYQDKRNSVKIKRDTFGNEARPHGIRIEYVSNYNPETEPDIYDYDAELRVNETTSNTNKHNYGYGAEPQNTRYGTNSKINNSEPGSYGYGAEPQNTRYGTNSKINNSEPGSYGYGAEPQNTRYGTNSKINNSEPGSYGYGAEPQNTRYGTNSKINNSEPGSYGYGAEPQNTRYGTNSKINNSEPGSYGYNVEPQTHFNGTTSKPRNDEPHPYDDARNNLEQAENVKKDNDESVVDIKMIVFIAIAAGSGILIGTIVGVLCRKKLKTPDSEPIVSFTTADPVYEDVYSAKMNVANRPPHPLPFEEREENKQYIHYDTPYDHRCGWKPPPRVVTFMK